MPFAVYFKELPLPRVVHRAPTELNPTPACELHCTAALESCVEI